MLGNIKEKKILHLITKTFLTELKYLILFKYNKSFKQLLNISLNDYKSFSAIKILLIPKKQLKRGENNFICINSNNLFTRKKSSFYHIFFDDNNEEINRDYITREDKVDKIKIIIDQEEKSLRGLFTFCECLKEIYFTNFKRKDIIDMREMFAFCKSLSKIDLTNFKTNNVTNMDQMFRSCLSLTEVDLSNLNTSKLTNMNDMFSGCCNLKKLNLSKIDTSNVITMNNIFNGCSSLEYIDLSDLNTSNVTDMGFMFFNCSSLKQIKFPDKINTSKVKDMSLMFSGCSGCKSLQKLNVSNFIINKKCCFRWMFSDTSQELKSTVKEQNKQFANIGFEDYLIE